MAKLKPFFLSSANKETSKIPLYKGSGINNNARRNATVFVKNERDWLIQSNGKIYTSALDEVDYKFGNRLSYQKAHLHPYHYEKLVKLLAGARIITEVELRRELQNIAIWERLNQREKKRQELLHLCDEMGVKLDRVQWEQLQKAVKE
jgi:hypothetical protein